MYLNLKAIFADFDGRLRNIGKMKEKFSNFLNGIQAENFIFMNL